MKIVVDKKEYEVPQGTNALDLLKEFDNEQAKKALVAQVNGHVQDLQAPINKDAKVKYLTFDDEEGRHTLRHTASHVLAAAVKNLYPDAKLAIGPAIENGFYYDFDREESFTPEDLINIEKEMKRIIKKNEREERFTLSRDEAIKLMKEKDEPYKIELIEDLPEDEEISFYSQGDFVDLCAGPHLPSTNKIKAIKLLSIAGAYWRGDEKNKMLQRIYGTAFTNKEDLDSYLLLEEAKRGTIADWVASLTYLTCTKKPCFPSSTRTA